MPKTQNKRDQNLPRLFLPVSSLPFFGGRGKENQPIRRIHRTIGQWRGNVSIFAIWFNVYTLTQLVKVPISFNEYFIFTSFVGLLSKSRKNLQGTPKTPAYSSQCVGFCYGLGLDNSILPVVSLGDISLEFDCPLPMEQYGIYG